MPCACHAQILAEAIEADLPPSGTKPLSPEYYDGQFEEDFAAPEPEDDQLTTEGTDLAGFSPRLRFILDSVLGPSAASRTLTRALRDKGVCSTIEMGNLADTPEELSSAFGDEPEGLLATWAACCRECEASVEAFARFLPAPPPEEAPPQRCSRNFGSQPTCLLA